MSRPSRATGLLALGSIGSGLLAYAFFTIGSRALGSAAAAPLAVLWSYWTFASAALTFPVQHWIARMVEAGDVARVRRTLPRVVILVACVAILAGAISWWARRPLFGSADPWWAVFVALVTVGAAGTGVVRGSLTAQRRFAALVASLIAENAIRCVGGVVLALLTDSGATPWGWAMVAGYLVMVCQPSALRLFRGQSVEGSRPALAFLTSASTGQLLGQLVLTGGPVVFAAAGGAPSDVTALFAGLALGRAPFLVATGVVAQVTGVLTRLSVSGAQARLHRLLLLVVGGVVVAAAVAGLVAAAAGPATIRLIFGHTVALASGACGLIGVASVFAVGNLVVSVFAIAGNRPHVIPAAWLVGIGIAAALLALGEAGQVSTVVRAFALAEFAALVVLAGGSRLPARRPAGAPR